MSEESRIWIHVGHFASFHFHVEKLTTIASIHAERRPKRKCGESMKDARCIIWAKCTSSLTSADSILCEQPPYVLASLDFGTEGLPAVSSLRWEIMEDTTVYLCLTRPSETPDMFHQSNGNSQSPRTHDAGDKLTEEGLPNSLCSTSLSLEYDFTVTLCGVTAVSMGEQSLWRPLLCFRWFELQEHVRKATTVAPLYANGHRERDKAAMHASQMIPGDVREASAVSRCGNYILWRDGSLGLRKELLSYRRQLTPTREDKHVRVRVFPHRYSDIVGEVPFGSFVESIGRAVDCYTKEEYALLILTGTPEAAVMAETYGLRYVGPGKWVWGWSKIKTCKGVFLLAEVHDTVNSRQHDKDWIERLQEPTYYTSVREGRRVRIRSEPSLSAEVIGHIDSNEVKLAVAVHHPSMSSHSYQDNSAAAFHHFVEWKDGGFSLLRNNDRIYLVPVQLQTQPRHFPVLPRPTPKSPDIIPLGRKHPRPTPSNGEYKRFNTVVTSPEEGLWSPSNVPQAVAAGVKAGSVRLEDLPIINLDPSSESSASLEDARS